jgi:predicted amidohydrolase YtcJ
MTSADRPADTLYVGGLVWTGEGSRAKPGAVWVRGDRIAGLGPDPVMRAAAGPEAQVVELAGAVVLPGLIDAHSHLTQTAYLLAGADCAQPAAPDIAAIQERLAHAAPGADGWVTGSGFAEYKLPAGRGPTRHDLDAAVSATPCVLYQVSLHACVVNSAGLAALGFTDATPDPPGGRFGRDADGHLDGTIFEQPMFDLIAANQARHAEHAPIADRVAEVERAARSYAALGITGCTEASIDPSGLAAVSAAAKSGRLHVRLTMLAWYDEVERVVEAMRASGARPERLRLGGVKLFADGGMSSRTAALDEPYAIPPYGTGVLLQPPAELAEQARRCAERGLQVAIHAQGDRGIRVALDALEPLSGGGNPLRHRIEHGGLFGPVQRRRAGAAGINVVSQPGFLSTLGDGFLDAFGPARSRDLYPFASLRDAGVLVAGSSDAPVITADPFLGVRDALLRRTERGREINPDEALTVTEALAMYTTRAAFVGHLEDESGSIAVGRAADLTIVAGDPWTVDPSRLAEVRVLRTVVGGRAVFERPGTADR